jgi:hypothetical protein
MTPVPPQSIVWHCVASAWGGGLVAPVIVLDAVSLTDARDATLDAPHDEGVEAHAPRRRR